MRYFHGMVTPANVIVSYEGEVRTRGFGYWPARIREAGGLTDEETLSLAPEQAAGGVGRHALRPLRGGGPALPDDHRGAVLRGRT